MAEPDLGDYVDAAKLLGATVLELSLEPDASGAWDNGGTDAEQWRELRRWLGEHLDSVQDGAQQDATSISSWQATLHDVGDRRQVICSNIMSYQQHLAREEGERLADEASDLRRYMKALREVQHAIDDAAYVSSVTATLLKINGLVEVLESGNPWDLIELPGPPDQDDIIESGIEMLGRYAVALELVSHGFGSIEELQRAIQSSLANLSEIRRRIQWAKHRHEQAEYLYAYPVMGER
ncbi:MAG TPA: hypothetical protein VF855_05135 [Acidimicrobiales bacterium]